MAERFGQKLKKNNQNTYYNSYIFKPKFLFFIEQIRSKYILHPYDKLTDFLTPQKAEPF